MEPNNESTACKHHWVLGQPRDGLIAGFCRKCDARRSYPAYIEDYGRSDQAEAESSEELAVTAVGGARLSRSASSASGLMSGSDS